MKSYMYVALQFGLIILIALYTEIWGGGYQNILMLVGLLIGIWAVVTMKMRVNVLPDVTKSQELYTNGIYKYIRHPMYLSVLMVTLAWVLNRIDFVSVSFWIILLAILLLKLHYEESLLTERFKKYADYKNRTKRLIPYVY